MIGQCCNAKNSIRVYEQLTFLSLLICGNQLFENPSRIPLAKVISKVLQTADE